MIPAIIGVLVGLGIKAAYDEITGPSQSEIEEEAKFNSLANELITMLVTDLKLRNEIFQHQHLNRVYRYRVLFSISDYFDLKLDDTDEVWKWRQSVDTIITSGNAYNEEVFVGVIVKAISRGN